MEKPIPTVGLNLRRGGAKLRALGKSHRPLHILLWQAHEVQSSLIANASSQNTLFSDIANWASSENRALSDVCAATSEIFSLFANAQVQLAVAFKSFRKDMALVLEGEKRCDTSQKKLQEAESKRLKLRRQLLRAQNRVQVNGENARRSGDFAALQTQLAEAERNAERSHTEACDVAKEQEAVKLVVLRTALSKLCQAQLLMADQTKIIFNGGCQIANEIPDPPPPGDPLSCVRYNGFTTTRSIISQVKSSVQRTLCTSPNGGVNQNVSPTTGQLFIIDNHTQSSLAMTPHSNMVSGPIGFATSTPLTSPTGVGHNTSSRAHGPGHCGHHRSASSPTWAAAIPEPSAPSLSSASFSLGSHEPPPPYNSDYISSPPRTAERSSRLSNASTGSGGTRRRYQNVSSVAPSTTPPNHNGNGTTRNSANGISPLAENNSPDQLNNTSLNYYYYNNVDTVENENSSSSGTRTRY